jgi:hypothetical protein
MRTGRVSLSAIMMTAFLVACVVQPRADSPALLPQEESKDGAELAPMLYFCPDRDIVIVNEQGGSNFYAYERQRYLSELEATEGGPVRALTISSCNAEEFGCVAFGIPHGKDGDAIELFRVLMPLDGEPGDHLKGGVRIKVSKVDGLAGERRRHLINWVDVGGKRQRLSAIWEQGRGLIYLTGINVDDLNDLIHGETCILQSGQGLLSDLTGKNSN